MGGMIYSMNRFFTCSEHALATGSSTPVEVVRLPEVSFPTKRRLTAKERWIFTKLSFCRSGSIKLSKDARRY